MELTYRKEGDYLIPNLMLKAKPPMILGKYAYLHRKYLHDHRRVLYINLLTADKLDEYLWDIEQTALERIEMITAQMTASAGVDEALKASNPLRWVGLMNAIRSAAEETILDDLIYA